MDELVPGLAGEVEAIVTEADTADRWYPSSARPCWWD